MICARRWVLTGALVLGGAGCAEPEVEVDPCDEPGAICTWLGRPGIAILSPDGLDRRKSGLYLPQDLVIAPDGTAYVADFNNHRIRRVAPDGLTDTVSGTGMLGDGPPATGATCWAPCVATGSDWWHPSQIALDPNDPQRLYVAAWHNDRISVVDVARDSLTWFVGLGDRGYSDGPRREARLALPSSVAAAADGTLYVSDQANQVIRRTTPSGEVQTLAGMAGWGGYLGDGGPAERAMLHGHADWVGGPSSKLALDGHTLWIADTMNGVVRAVDLDTGLISTEVGRFVSGASVNLLVNPRYGVFAFGEAWSVPGYEGDGGDARDAVLAFPRDVAVGPDGELYVADTANHCVRVVRDGIISTLAGTCGEQGFEGDQGPAVDARMDVPCGVEVDAHGNVFVADSNNHVIRRIASGEGA